MDQRSRTHTVLAEDPSLVPSIWVRQLTTTINQERKKKAVLLTFVDEAIKVVNFIKS